MVLRIYFTFFRKHAYVKINRVFYNSVIHHHSIRSFIHYIDWKTESSTHPDWFYEKASIVNTTGAHQQGLWIAKMIYQTLRGS